MLRFGASRIRYLWSGLALRHPRQAVTSAQLFPDESFLKGTSCVYIEELYESWSKDPSSVHKSWNNYFSQLSDAPSGQYSHPVDLEYVRDQLRVQSLIRAYQVRGHQIASVDPLSPSNAEKSSTELRAQEKRILSKEDIEFIQGNGNMQRFFELPSITRIGNEGEKKLTLAEVHGRLRKAYCGNIGIEFMFIEHKDQCDWIRGQFESPNAGILSKAERRTLMSRLIRSSEFEQFLADKWPSEKRFGLEGCEVLVPALLSIIDHCSVDEVDSFILGMPHRGRLNVLANVANQRLKEIFTEFDPVPNEEGEESSGDVKYHLGTYSESKNIVSQREIKLSLMANPSHLEAVGPVVQGRTKAEQFYNDDKKGKKAMSILLHGDAAFAGQGVVYETFHLNDYPQYTTNGTIHVVVNNQIGFTTDPRVVRLSRYCTDVAKAVNAPIFHVNADDVEAVMHVCYAAAKWRNTYYKDVVIDLVCYRRNGHNEADQPAYTQPSMYQKIEKHERVLSKYKDQLIKAGIFSEEEFQDEVTKYKEICKDGFDDAKNNPEPKLESWLHVPWKDFYQRDRETLNMSATGVEETELSRIGYAMSTDPGDGFAVHTGLTRMLKKRKEMVDNQKVDWALGESMAFASLLRDGVHVRLSGQDVERGTFSHRHHLLHDQKLKQDPYVALRNLYPHQAPYTVCNSSLSEFAVLGFELGFSLNEPLSLVCWEAQFGDFSNNAQCIIDQFISCGQDKWYRQCGLVVLLPHGYEGMGPEHSSARLERFLQMSIDDPDTLPDFSDKFEVQQLYDTNWIVANCTTPANYFHILRRQLAMPFRKPLIIMSPKSLLRLPEARSSFDDMTQGTSFRRVISDASVPASEDVDKLVFCSGKVYYDLEKARKSSENGANISIVRVEQLAPFPFDLVKNEVDKYPNADIVWVQEEPKNMGAWTYVQPRILAVLDGKKSAKCVARPPSAAPATGNKNTHKAQQEDIIGRGLSLQK